VDLTGRISSGYNSGLLKFHTAMRQKLIVGNWKMNGSLAANAALLAGVTSGLAAGAKSRVAVCVPAPYLAQCQHLLEASPVAWGAQDVSAQAEGAFTGEVSAGMLQDFACRYVIVGHSERRTYHAEGSALVARKAVQALAAGLVPIVCVGETLAEREAGHTESVVGEQLEALLAALAPDELSNVVLAYEPVWAIGTGKTATPEMAQQVHAMLRAQMAQFNAEAAAQVAILYGGSMKPDNAQQLLAMPDIDGGLIGGAALKAADFLAIVAAADA
jgi:triosephosphate isomerase